MGGIAQTKAVLLEGDDYYTRNARIQQIDDYEERENLKRERDRAVRNKVVKFISKIVYEDIPQMVLQVSATLAAGTGVAGQPMLLASLIFGCGMLFLKTAELCAELAHELHLEFCILFFFVMPVPTIRGAGSFPPSVLFRGLVPRKSTF